ncbi:MAG: ATP-binding cassette domain-containing protein [Coprobacillaceae bacterium]
MLELKDITRWYQTGEEKTNALDGVSLNFGNNEFVSILGSSGSGKTTLLNIIGGLDKYSSGDMIVDGKSTKEFSDKDWDSYRNSAIGFVFQSYNLIAHLSVLDNVSIALSLSGVSAKEREVKAKQALIDVGLESHINKKPNQLSGGQMQRVAIARALVNNPKILLADEPTGALDSKTSVQIMELIKQISKDRLVIMVTHNPDLANQYSDRIVRLADGRVIEDTKPLIDTKELNHGGYIATKTSMSFFTAMKSSFKNLLTKKTRTALVAFAGSIGIISIALVLAISAGMSSYVTTMQKDTLSGLPITISNTTSTSFNRFSQGMENALGGDEEEGEADSNVINVEEEAEAHTNIYSEDVLEKGYTFSEYLEENANGYYSSISYTSGYQLKAVTKNTEDEIQEVKSQETRNTNVFSQLPENKEAVLNQYTVVASIEDNFEYPTQMNQVVLILGSENEISENILTALGYDSNEEIKYEDILGKTISIVSNDAYYEQYGEQPYFMNSMIDETMYNEGVQAQVVAVLKENEGSTVSLLSTGIGYTKALTDYMYEIEKDSQIVTTQRDNPTINVLSNTTRAIEETAYDTIMQQLGGDTTPTQILIYPSSFDNKEKIIDVINDYNTLVEEKFGIDSEEYKTNSIAYTDMAETLASTMTTMIDTVTMILTALAAISLVVSSIMIGIITYVSVVERTKEIGIMRAIGARKKDISRIFNAEAIIIGLTAGLLGVGFAYLITIPLNQFITTSINVTGFTASLSVMNGTILVILSVALTFIAGLIPSRIASKRNPVEALRTE